MSIVPAVLTIQLENEEAANKLINNTNFSGKKSLLELRILG
jgi:hypothetical protein